MTTTLDPVAITSHPGWSDPDWRDGRGRPLFVLLMDEHGCRAASSAWTMAASWAEHLTTEHASGTCDCG